ncbi:hypothetical protein BDV19DRAFT_361316, partial [Aspergillus venezuelensis]
MEHPNRPIRKQYSNCIRSSRISHLKAMEVWSSKPLNVGHLAPRPSLGHLRSPAPITGTVGHSLRGRARF